jgi:hypothetical protein
MYRTDHLPKILLLTNGQSSLYLSELNRWPTNVLLLLFLVHHMPGSADDVPCA